MTSKKKNVKIEKGPMWQGGKLLVWRPKKAGEDIALRFTAPADSRYSIMLACKFSSQGGAFKAALDGKAIKFDNQDALKLDAPHGVLSRTVGVGSVALKAGKHVMTFTAVDTGKEIGLDFMGLKKK